MSTSIDHPQLLATSLCLSAALERLFRPDPHRFEVPIEFNVWDNDADAVCRGPGQAAGAATWAAFTAAPLPEFHGALVRLVPGLDDIRRPLAELREVTGRAGEDDPLGRVVQKLVGELLKAPWGGVALPDYPVRVTDDEGCDQYLFRCVARLRPPSLGIVARLTTLPHIAPGRRDVVPLDPPAVELGDESALQFTVLSAPKTVSSVQVFGLIAAMLAAHPYGLRLGDVQKHHTRGQQVLAGLRKQDDDWRRAIAMPGRRNKGGYRIRRVSEAMVAPPDPPTRAVPKAA
jgi:hypothetical protein